MGICVLHAENLRKEKKKGCFVLFLLETLFLMKSRLRLHSFIYFLRASSEPGTRLEANQIRNQSGP